MRCGVLSRREDRGSEEGGNTEKEEGEEQGGYRNEESSQFVNVNIRECGNEIQGDCQRCGEEEREDRGGKREESSQFVNVVMKYRVIASAA